MSLWVELVKQRRHVRYVGLTVDEHPSTRIGEGFFAAVGADTDKTRLTNFMAINAACKWRTFRIPALQTGLANVSTSPLSDMLDKSAPPLLPMTSVPTTRGILLKANNGIAAPIEAALIHSCDA